MIDLILPERRTHFASALMAMHRDRKRVFVDRMGWRLDAPGSWLEVDQFDNQLAVYLLARTPEENHRGSVRLLPTTGPHMMDSLFADLCADDVIKADDCWEISRLVTSPDDARGTSILRIHRLLALALAEFAELNSIRRYVLVTEAHRMPTLLSVGWRVTALGLPAIVDGEELVPLQIHIDENTLPKMRARFRLAAPVLRMDAEQKLAA